METKAWSPLVEDRMAVGLSDGVFKARLLLIIESYPDIGTRGVFKRLMLGISRFAGLYMGAAIFFSPFMPIGPPGPVCLCCG